MRTTTIKRSPRGALGKLGKRQAKASRRGGRSLPVAAVVAANPKSEQIGIPTRKMTTKSRIRSWKTTSRLKRRKKNRKHLLSSVAAVDQSVVPLLLFFVRNRMKRAWPRPQVAMMVRGRKRRKLRGQLQTMLHRLPRALLY
jgi:hypothetical protein